MSNAMTATAPIRLTCLLAAVLLTGLLAACGKPEPPTVNLYRAIHTGDLDQIKRHIFSGTDLNQAGPEGDFPLHVAARRGRVVIARELLANGAQVDARNGVGHTPLQVALIEGKTQVAEVLLAQGAADDPQALLFLLAREGVTDRDSLSLVVRLGARVDAKDDGGATALHVAVEQDNLALAKRMVDMGADVNALDAQGRTPLGIATARGNRDIATLLLGYGALSSPDPGQPKSGG
jgi:ankyrin repeat protein